jgi:hypothetical protein
MASKFALYGNLGFAPRVAALLNSIDDTACSHNHYGLRHPADIFHAILSGLATRFTALLQVVSPIENARSEAPQPNDESVELYKELLEAFFRYVDCGYEIILTLCEKQVLQGGQNKFLYKWLNAQDKRLKNHGFEAGSLYYSIIKQETAFFRLLHNELKHSSNCLRPVTVQIGLQRCFGYFLEGADSNGTIGPSRAFHKSVNGQRSANSFSRDLRLLYHSTYLVGDALRKALTFLYKERHKCDPVEHPSTPYDDALYKDLFERISALPQLYYSTEAGKVIPLAVISIENNLPFLVFSEFKAPMPYGPFRVSARTVVHRGGKYQVPLP